MEKNKQLVPKRRFKEFEGDREWKQKRLGDIATEIIAGGDIDRSKISNKGKYPVLANALSNDGVVGYYKKDYRVTGPAVTVTGRGDIGHATARKTNFTPVVRLLAIKSKYDVDFLENIINNQNSFVESTGVPQLTVPKLSDYRIYIPESIYEGNMIGRFIDSLDNIINLQLKKINKIKRIKLAYLSTMFPREGDKYPEKRFEGFTESWKNKRLNEITNYVTSSLSAGKSMSEGKYKLYDANEVIGYANTGHHEVYVTIIKDGSGVGRVRLLPKDSNFIGTMGGILSKEKTDINYLYAFLQQFDFTDYIIGATIPHVYFKDYGESSSFHPCVEEQIKIGKFFKNLDAQIELEQQKLNKLQQLKQAYLNELFV